MGRPAAKELTERELEVMHVFWERGEMTAAVARDVLAEQGLDRAYATVANLIRILADKQYLRPTNDERPFRYVPVRTRDEVSRGFVGELLQRLFGGSRERLLAHLLGDQRKLTAAEKRLLQQILDERS